MVEVTKHPQAPLAGTGVVLVLYGLAVFSYTAFAVCGAGLYALYAAVLGVVGDREETPSKAYGTHLVTVIGYVAFGLAVDSVEYLWVVCAVAGAGIAASAYQRRVYPETAADGWF